MARRSWKNWKGWKTTPDLLDVEEGVLAAAVNVGLTRDGLILPRRGILNHSTIATATNIVALWEWDGYRFAHWNNGVVSKLSRTDGTVWTEIGTYEHPDEILNDSEYRLHGAEVNARFFFVSAAGVYRMDSPITAPVFAGAPKCPDIDRYGSTTANLATGILAPRTQTAYRAVVFFEDADGRRVVGSPSGRCVLSNENASGGSNKAPVVRVLLPKQNNTASTALTTSYGIQLYRSDATDPALALAVDPLDVMGLVFEDFLTAANITAGYVDVSDITPDGMQADFLYTNSTQGTAIGANEPPPFAYVVGEYQGCLLLANTLSRQTLKVAILSVDTTHGIMDTDTFILTGAATLTLRAMVTPTLTTDFKIETGATTTSQKIALTAQNLCAAINRHASNTFCYAYYSGRPSDPRTVGEITIEGRQGLGGSFTAHVGTGDNSTCYWPTLPVGAAGDVVSTADAQLNGWALSRPGLPDAFPPLQNGRCGAGAIVAVAALDDEAFLFHDSGEVWRMSGIPGNGTDPGTLRVEPWRSNLNLLSRSTLQRLDHHLICLTNQGIVAMNGAGYETIDTDVREGEDQLGDKPIAHYLQLEGSTLYQRTRGWAAVNPVERRYLLGLWDGAADFQVAIHRSGSGTWETSTFQASCAAWMPSSGSLFYGERGVVAPAKVYYESATETYGDGTGTTAIEANLLLPPITTGRPMQVREYQLVFEGDQPTVTPTFVTELAGVAGSAITSQGTNTCRIPVPLSCQRAARHQLKLVISATTQWRLSEIRMLYREYGERPTK